MSPLREFKPEAADFLVRAPLTPPLPQLISPETGPVVGLSIANAMKQFGVGIGQIRHDLSAPFISERCVEAWLGRRSARIRVTMDQIEVAVSEGKPRGWALGLPLFDALFLALSAVLPEAKFGSVITSWNLHLAPSGAHSLTELLPSVAVKTTAGIGELLSVGYALNFGAAPWDSGIEGTTVLAEASTQVPNGVYLSLRSSWRLSAAEPLVQRFFTHTEKTMSSLGIKVSDES